MRRTVFSALVSLTVACGIPAVDTVATCERGGLHVAVESGVTDGGAGEATAACERSADELDAWRATYEAGWGRLPLEGWTVRVRAGATLEDGWATGRTYHAARTIDIVHDGLLEFPHELHHAHLGPASDDHHGWCHDFEPWEERTFAYSERSYLHCD